MQLEFIPRTSSTTEKRIQSCVSVRTVPVDQPLHAPGATVSATEFEKQVRLQNVRRSRRRRNRWSISPCFKRLPESLKQVASASRCPMVSDILQVLENDAGFQEDVENMCLRCFEICIASYSEHGESCPSTAAFPGRGGCVRLPSYHPWLTLGFDEVTV